MIYIYIYIYQQLQLKEKYIRYIYNIWLFISSITSIIIYTFLVSMTWMNGRIAQNL